MGSESSVLELYKFIAEEAQLGFVVCDISNFEVKYINRSAENSLSKKIQSIHEMSPKSERPPFLSFNGSLLEQEGLHQEILVQKGETCFIATINVKAIGPLEENLRLVMIQDVTLQMKLQRELNAKQAELKMAFEDLLKQNQQLKELDAAKDKFIALTTHELRTPVSAILATADVLKLGFYESEEELKEFIGMIHEQGHHLLELVNDILDFAKIQAGKMDFYIEPHDLVEFSKSLYKGFTKMAEQNGIELIPFKMEEKHIGYFDSLRLNQVLSNIITNAIKYNVKGGTVTLSIEEIEDHIKISVTDTGKGISPEDLNKVFDEFETLGQVSQHHKGTGLGMPISRKLIHGMGGRLLVESELGKGSTFWVEVPKNKVLEEELYRSRPTQLDDLAA